VKRDTGSSLPFVLLCFLVAAVLVAAVTTASSAFLAQRDLQADCDGAAVAAASGVDVDAVYAGDVVVEDALPLASEQALSAVAEYQTVGGVSFDAAVTVDAGRVTVACQRVVTVPFGRLFDLGEGLERSTVSTARTPVRG
jgi:hypothetical protein